MILSAELIREMMDEVDVEDGLDVVVVVEVEVVILEESLEGGL
jgi:hypothetical protein